MAHRRRDAGAPIQVARVAPELRHLREPTRAFEQPRVHGVEAHERRKQSPVAFHGLVAEQEAAAPKTLLQLVERFEQFVMRTFVDDL